jgi:hypothetical protein
MFGSGCYPALVACYGLVRRDVRHYHGWRGDYLHHFAPAIANGRQMAVLHGAVFALFLGAGSTTVFVGGHRGLNGAVAVGVVLKPLVFFILAAVVLYPIRRAFMKWFPEGKLKRLLLRRVN